MKPRVCVDASLMSRWVMPTEQDPNAEALLEGWNRAGIELIAPPLFDAEVTSTIRKNVYLKRLLPEQGDSAFLMYRELGVTLTNYPELPEVAWLLAIQYDQIRTYDMQYLAVAELADCDLWTADRRLVNLVRGESERVKWLGDYQT